MGCVRRTITGISGIVLLIVGITFSGFILTIGTLEWTYSVLLAGMILLAAAGVLFILAWVRDSMTIIGTTVWWPQLHGLGTILIALGWMIGSIPAAISDPLLGGIVLVGGLVLVWIGYDGVVDGQNIDFESEISPIRLVGLLLVGSLLLAGGTLAMTLYNSTGLLLITLGFIAGATLIIILSYNRDLPLSHS